MMTGYAGTSKTGTVYHYYICNGHKAKVCTKKNVRKEYIEALLVQKCREQLTDENIQIIAKEVAAVCAADYDTSMLKHLRTKLKEVEKGIENLLLALESGQAADIIAARISQRSAEKAELERQISIEMQGQIPIDEKEILFFLYSLQKGAADNDKYRKMLINIFLVAAYLYDDKLTYILTVGGETITVTKSLMDAIDESNAGFLSSFFNGTAPPKDKPCIRNGYRVFSYSCNGKGDSRFLCAFPVSVTQNRVQVQKLHTELHMDLPAGGIQQYLDAGHTVHKVGVFPVPNRLHTGGDFMPIGFLRLDQAYSLFVQSINVGQFLSGHGGIHGGNTVVHALVLGGLLCVVLGAVQLLADVLNNFGNHFHCFSPFDIAIEFFQVGPVNGHVSDQRNADSLLFAVGKLRRNGLVQLVDIHVAVGVDHVQHGNRRMFTVFFYQADHVVGGQSRVYPQTQLFNAGEMGQNVGVDVSDQASFDLLHSNHKYLLI